MLYSVSYYEVDDTFASRVSAGIYCSKLQEFKVIVITFLRTEILTAAYFSKGPLGSYYLRSHILDESRTHADSEKYYRLRSETFGDGLNEIFKPLIKESSGFKQNFI